MSQIEYACREVIFHFNKKHLEDPTIPMWVLKTKGKSYYVEHVDCRVPWSTKETPENSHTKGSIKIKNCLLTIDDDNCATLSELTDEDNERLRVPKEPIRTITKHGEQLKTLLKQSNIEHGPIKNAGGGCGTLWYITDIYNDKHLTLLSLSIPDFRTLMPNEAYYKMYEQSLLTDSSWIDEYDDDEDWDESDED